MRVRPRLLIVLLTIPFSQMGCAETIVWRDSDHAFSSNLDVCKREVHAIAGALKVNKGLVESDLGTCCYVLNDETWGVIFDSLETHPTLEVLNLSSGFADATMAPEVITSRMQALSDMVKVNLSIHTILLQNRHYRQFCSRRWVARKQSSEDIQTTHFRLPWCL